MSSQSLAHRVERQLHVVVLSTNLTISDRVLRCLSVTAVTVTTAGELGTHSGRPLPDAMIVFADGYPARQVTEFVRDQLRSSGIRRIVLVSEEPCQFQTLCDAEGTDRRLVLFSLSVWGWNVLDAILSLSAKLALDVRRSA
jgi:hypothetical protein